MVSFNFIAIAFSLVTVESDQPNKPVQVEYTIGKCPKASKVTKLYQSDCMGKNINVLSAECHARRSNVIKQILKDYFRQNDINIIIHLSMLDVAKAAQDVFSGYPALGFEGDKLVFFDKAFYYMCEKLHFVDEHGELFGKDQGPSTRFLYQFARYIAYRCPYKNMVPL